MAVDTQLPSHTRFAIAVLFWRLRLKVARQEKAPASEDRSNSKIFVTGVTDGDLDGHTDTDPDIFLMQFDLDGNWESTTFHGSSARDVALGLHLDRSKLHAH